MIEALGFYAAGYGIGTAIVLLLGTVRYMDARGPVSRREGARMIFGAPAWPVIGVCVVARNLRQAWRDADWKGKA
jgi:hypothetical protein